MRKAIKERLDEAQSALDDFVNNGVPYIENKLYALIKELHQETCADRKPAIRGQIVYYEEALRRLFVKFDQVSEITETLKKEYTIECFLTQVLAKKEVMDKVKSYVHTFANNASSTFKIQERKMQPTKQDEDMNTGKRNDSFGFS